MVVENAYVHVKTTARREILDDCNKEKVSVESRIVTENEL